MKKPLKHADLILFEVLQGSAYLLTWQDLCTAAAADSARPRPVKSPIKSLPHLTGHWDMARLKDASFKQASKVMNSTLDCKLQ
jgi:hypothetical protein